MKTYSPVYYLKWLFKKTNASTNIFHILLVWAIFILSPVLLEAQPCTGGTSDGALSPTSSWQTIAIDGTHYRTFSATAGYIYIFSFCSDDGGSSIYDTYLSLNTNPGDVNQANNDDYCSTQSRISWTCTSSGSYKILATKYASMTYCNSQSGLGTLAYEYIAPTVYNSYNSTLYTTIQAAVNALPASWAADYTIEIQSSNTYSEAVSISGFTTNGHTVTIQAQSGQTPIVNGGSSGPCFSINNSNITIQNLAMTGVSASYNAVNIGVATKSDNITINQCKIYSNGSNAIEEYFKGGNNLIIKNCLIYSNGGDAVQIYNKTAETGLQIINNTIYNNNTAGSQWGGITLTPYSTAYSITGTIIKNNIIQVNGYSSVDACLVFGYTGEGTYPTYVAFTQCDYNDLYNASGGGHSSYVGYTNYSTNSYSTLTAWKAAVTPIDANSISSIPYFVNAPTDFHEMSATYGSYHGGEWPPTTATAGTWTTNDAHTSPCIDAGLATDAYSNEPSCNGGRINMGCYGNTVQASKSNTSLCCTATVSSLSPSSACSGSGATVTITGTNFTSATSVTFNGTSASFSITNSTTISATLPGGATTGTISVVTSTCGTATSGSFTVNPNPTITTSGTLTSVCYSASLQTTGLDYTATSYSPTSYSIDWATLTDQSASYSFSSGSSTLTGLNVPAGTTAATYSGTMTITNGNSCTATQAVSLTVNATTISAPSTSSATNIAATSFTANWGSVAAATVYYLDVSTDPAFGSFINTDHSYHNYSVAGTSQSVGGLTENSTYYYRVSAHNSCATSSYDSPVTTVTAIAAPGSLGFNITGDFTNNGTLDQTNDANYLIMSGSSKSIKAGSGIYTQTKLRSSGTITFNGTIASGSFTKTFVDAAKTFTVESSKTYINGDFVNEGTTTLNSSSAWQNSGMWINNGTVTADATSTVTFNGTASQNVQSNSSAFGNVTMSQSVTTPSSSNGVSMLDAMSLKSSSTLTLTKGVIVTNNFLLTINNAAAAAVTSSDYTQSWVYGTSLSGALRRYLGTNDAGVYVFPVGKAATCNRAVLTNNILTSSLYIDCFFNTSYSSSNLNTGFPGNLSDGNSSYNGVLTDGVWELTPSTSITGNYDLKLYFNGFSPLPSDNKFGIISRPTGTTATSWSVTGLGTVVALPVSGNYAQRTGITTFSEKGIATANGNLPVELLYFIASCDDERIKIKWTTATELNNDYFKVEKSRDNNIWDYVTTVSGAGNSNSQINYTIYDEAPYAETVKGTDPSYYRLKQVDFDGKYTYYGPVTTICKAQYTFNAYVNANREINVNFDASNDQIYQINLFDYNGKKLIELSGKANDGLNNVALNTVNLSAGMYILVFKNGTEYETKKIVLN